MNEKAKASAILEQALADRWCAASGDQCIMLERAIFEALRILGEEEEDIP